MLLKYSIIYGIITIGQIHILRDEMRSSYFTVQSVDQEMKCELSLTNADPKQHPLCPAKTDVKIP